MTQAMPVVVFAVGNPSRGDDAIGPLLLERLADWLVVEGLADQFELVEDFQLQIEHVLDLQGRQLALFIDAGAIPGALYLPRIERHRHAPNHARTAAGGCVAGYRQTESADRRGFVLCVRGEKFELGEALTELAERNVAQALIADAALPPAALADWQPLPGRVAYDVMARRPLRARG